MTRSMTYCPTLARTVAAAFLLSAAAFGQAGRAELFGTVIDPAGLAVSAADVGAQNVETGASLKTTTNESGEFHFFALLPGDYQLTATKTGFMTLRRSGIRLRVADRISLDLQLQIGEVTQSVEVSAATPLLQTTTGTENFIVGENRISTLPLDGRNYVPLIALSAGVALPPGSTASPSVLPRINGSRPRTNEYIYDGISVLQPEPGQVAYYPIIDAIEEFRVDLNSYSAEYGRSNGGVIQVSSKSGTNDFHGTLFEFFRNDALNARNLFALPGPTPPFKRNQYGLVFGGPIQKNKTFFFVDWQGTRLRDRQHQNQHCAHQQAALRCLFADRAHLRSRHHPQRCRRQFYARPVPGQYHPSEPFRLRGSWAARALSPSQRLCGRQGGSFQQLQTSGGR